MKRILLAAGVVLMAGCGVRAGEITVKVTDADQAAFGNLPAAVDACVAGLQLRGDPQICRAISVFAGEFGAKVKAAIPVLPAKQGK